MGLIANLMTIDDPLLVVLAGPTAAGKTQTGIELAHHFNTEILSSDSRQFFREMKIGTAVPSQEELAAVNHHFIGHLSIHDSYNVSKYETEALSLLERLFQHHRIIFLVGGSGLYIRAVCHGIDLLPDPDPAVRADLKSILTNQGITALQDELKKVDPIYAASVDLANSVRLIRGIEIYRTMGVPFSSLRMNRHKERPFRILKIGITHTRQILNERINDRVDRMINEGLVEEAKSLLQYRYLNALNTVGYKEMFDYFDGKYSLELATEKIKTHTRRYAKRQMTWFIKEPGMRWFESNETNPIAELIKKTTVNNLA